MKLEHYNSQNEHPVEFFCESQSLIGIYHRANDNVDIGVLIYSGGFQTRTGAHRKFVELARAISGIGIAVFRFEARGLGDSEGSVSEGVSKSDDIECAINQFQNCCESLQRIIIISMCDGASSGLHYAERDSRITALILINPWISRSENETALTLKKYYTDRLFSPGFWSSFVHRRIDLVKMTAGMLKSIKQLALHENSVLVPEDLHTLRIYFRYEGKIALILSGNDMVAAEFENALDTSGLSFSSKCIESNRFVMKFPESDHTFSDRSTYEALQVVIIGWLGLQK